MPTPKKRAIGEMNGTNAALFRFLLISYPFLASALLTWGAWVTVSVSKFNAFIQHYSGHYCAQCIQHAH